MNTTHSLEEIRQIQQEAELICDQDMIEQALTDMAVAITQNLHDRNPLCLSLLTGGIIPTGLLLTQLDFPLQLDSIQATRYRGNTQGEKLHWKKYPDMDIKNRTLLIIDDILDEGITMQAVVEYCKQAGAQQVYTAVLVDKENARAPDGLPAADFTGLKIPNRYVFGFGLDYHHYLRNAAGIYAVKGL
ncbi:hypoxanthine-guanine phosphoribosyltransferase [Candidatus Venteria ishoeyi]|uniref:Hypoxanthine-guanine phosphoribosyltransferase n=1 Tax=Candidatus Venteria ishoeyi TaxID=1899563 RepID=A0A1H6FA50_9GAMM|nr:hypoxanthine-guanine phosphoribosyltransferase [Candidatus Venteria ishoeyi]SEH05885.1 Hypoxanthine-guanine phosphoribosyltransferase [Candidatus Venteria ishoeyi]